MNMQMTDLKVQYARIREEVDRAIAEVVKDAGFILGKPVELLEREVAAYHGTAFAVGVASGTDALVLSLAALGISQGDEVITTPFTFIATAEAISRVGATPVFCDIDEATCNIDASLIGKKITGRTKAVIPVHLYGLSSNMAAITAAARKKGLKIVEDCAQSFGSRCDGKTCGSIGDCGCLSFFPAKTLGCFGDGGMIVTNDRALSERIKVLRNHGSAAKYMYCAHGYNSRLDTIQAAVLRVKLRLVDQWIEERRANAAYYDERLSRIPGIRLLSVPSNCRHTYNYYTIRIPERDRVQKALQEKGIPSMVYYPLSLHLQEVYKGLGYKAGDMPAAEKAQAEVLSLPMYPELTHEQMDLVINALKASL